MILNLDAEQLYCPSPYRSPDQVSSRGARYSAGCVRALVSRPLVSPHMTTHLCMYACYKRAAHCIRRTRLLSDADGESGTVIQGGEFNGCRSTENGAFMFASDGAIVTITGGTVTNCLAERRAGVVSDG